MWRAGPALAKTAGMDVVLSAPSASDAAQFIDAVRASRSLHRPWLDLPDTPGRFAAYLDRSGREDQANYLIRHRACGGLVGVVNISNIVRGGLQSGYLGYGAFASHAGRGLMTEGLRAVLGVAFGEQRLHRVEATLQPGQALDEQRRGVLVADVADDPAHGVPLAVDDPAQLALRQRRRGDQAVGQFVGDQREDLGISPAEEPVMRVTAPYVVVDRLAVPGQDVLDYPGRLGGRQARGTGHPLDEIAVVHRPIVHRFRLTAKFLPEFGQELA